MLFREELDKGRCQAAGCDHGNHRELFLTPKCHPKKPVLAKYDLKEGCVSLSCSDCGALITEIAVASIRTEELARMVTAPRRH